MSLRLSFSIALAAASLLLSSAVPARADQPAAVPAPVPAFDPVAFFSGGTEGVGRLKKAMSAAQEVHVRGRGQLRNGVLVIDQTVAVEGEPAKTRQWQLRQPRPGHFSGTLSDARGPVTATVEGNRLLIHYVMADQGLAVEQVITLAPGGRSAQNAMKFRKFGIVVATLDETIRRN